MRIRLGSWCSAALLFAASLVARAAVLAPPSAPGRLPALLTAGGASRSAPVDVAPVGVAPAAAAPSALFRPVAPEVDEALLRAERIGAESARALPAAPGHAPAFVLELAARLRDRADAVVLLSADATAAEGDARRRRATEGLDALASAGLREPAPR
jgi:hypothetical protein